MQLEQGYNHWQSSEAELPPLEPTVPTDRQGHLFPPGVSSSVTLFASLTNFSHVCVKINNIDVLNGAFACSFEIYIFSLAESTTENHSVLNAALSILRYDD
jgi:hypothetical protein